MTVLIDYLKNILLILGCIMIYLIVIFAMFQDKVKANSDIVRVNFDSNYPGPFGGECWVDETGHWCIQNEYVYTKEYGWKFYNSRRIQLGSPAKYYSNIDTNRGD